MAAAGNDVYVADQFSGLEVIDVSNPTKCVRVGGYASRGDARAVAVVGKYAYLADGGGSQVIDVSNPANCVRVGGYALLTGFPYAVD